MDDFQNILENGINFGRGGDKPKDDGKVKTKAKKKKYITGAHGSGSAMQKAKYRKLRANRKKEGGISAKQKEEVYNWCSR